MGVLDTVARALIEVKADVSDAKKGLKDLTGTERELAEAQLKAAQQRNEGLDTWVERLGHASLALEGVGRVVEFATESMKTYGETLRLEAAAGSTNIDALADSFNGLITEHQALQFAAQATHGVLKVTQEQMETVGKATVALSRAGFDQTEVFAKLQDAVVSLKTRGLDDYGIAVKEGKTNTETLNNIIDALNKKVQENSGLMETEAERVQRASNQWADFKENLSAATAQMFIALPPMQDVARQLQEIDKFYYNTGDELPGQGGSILSTEALFGKGFDYDQIVNEHADSLTHVGDAWSAINDGITSFEAHLIPLGDKVEHWGAKTKKAYDDATAAAKALIAAQRALSNQVAKGLTDDLVKQLEDEQSRAFLDKGVTGGLGSITPETSDASMNAAMAKLAQKSAYDSEKTHLEKIFGPLDDFNGYTKAFDALTGAVGSAYDAWVTGSESAGAAVKKFIGEMLLGVGKQMAIEAIKYEAYAVASLVPGPFFNPAAATGYAVTGAAFAAGAIAAGVAAHELGAGGSSTPTKAAGGSASTGGSAGPGSGSAAQPTAVTIVVGDPFAEQTQRQRALTAGRLVSMGMAAANNSVVQDQ